MLCVPGTVDHEAARILCVCCFTLEIRLLGKGSSLKLCARSRNFCSTRLVRYQDASSEGTWQWAVEDTCLPGTSQYAPAVRVLSGPQRRGCALTRCLCVVCVCVCVWLLEIQMFPRRAQGGAQSGLSSGDGRILGDG